MRREEEEAMKSLLLFAGTTEGRRLAEALAVTEPDMPSTPQVTVCVATDYGETLLPEAKNMTVLSGRRDRKEIAALLDKRHYDCVVDATHPYAEAATDNIRDACADADVPYLRLQRPASAPEPDCVFVPSAEAAVAYLNSMDCPVLLTTGSKELEQFAAVQNYRSRLYARVLPTADSLESCGRLGLPGKQIICMQGPFSKELNAAMLRQAGAGVLVTKESGRAGGFLEKVQGARLAGAVTLVIGRPPQTEGHDYETIKVLLAERFGFVFPGSENSNGESDVVNRKPPDFVPGQEEKRYFPLFLALEGKKAMIFGGGPIALRRIRTLLEFGPRLTVVAPEVAPEMMALAEHKKLTWLPRPYEPGDTEGAALVAAATNCREVNRAIGLECAARRIPVSVADRKEECTFYFPGVVALEHAVIGVCAGGRDHRLARRLTEAIRERIKDFSESEEEVSAHGAE